MKLFLIILCTLFALILSGAPAYADGNCLPINNGGPTVKQVCFTPTVWPTPAPFTEIIPNQNENGHSVYTPSTAKTTPDTGPSDWSLPSLLLLGGLGFYLKKRSNNIQV